MSKHTKRGWNQDRDLVAGEADHEVETLQAAMKKEGIKISAQQIRNLIIEFGHSRERLEQIIRESFPKNETPAENEGKQ